MRLAALAVASLLTPVAALADECAAPFTVDDLLSELNRVEFAAQDGDASVAGSAARDLEKGLGCLDARLVPALVGRTYRSMAAGFIVGGDQARGEAWMLTAVEVDPQFSFGLEEFAADHPVSQALRRLQQTAGDPEPVAVGRSFVEGRVFLNGRQIREPAATLGRPHLLQLDTDSVRSWVIEGATFPEAILVSDTPAAAKGADAKPKKEKAAKAPKAAKERSAKSAGPTPAPADGSFQGVRQRPPEKTPLIIGGAAVVLGAGAMYTGAILSRRKFDSIGDSESDLRRAQLATNRLFLGSIAVFAIGAGTTTWGIILDGGTAMPHVHVRF